MSQRTSRQPTHPHKCRLCAKPHTLSASPPRSGPCRCPRKTHSIFFFSRARRAPPNNFFLHAATTVSCILQFAACSSHGRKIVDLYICEQFGHLLVTVGQFANPIAEYGLHKMLRSRCFATIIQRPISRTAHCSRNATRSYRLLWNECAQLTLISARDFNVTDASRTMRARF